MELGDLPFGVSVSDRQFPERRAYAHFLVTALNDVHALAVVFVNRRPPTPGRGFVSVEAPPFLHAAKPSTNARAS
jgi:hypothetical protein